MSTKRFTFCIVEAPFGLSAKASVAIEAHSTLLNMGVDYQEIYAPSIAYGSVQSQENLLYLLASGFPNQEFSSVVLEGVRKSHYADMLEDDNRPNMMCLVVNASNVIPNLEKLRWIFRTIREWRDNSYYGCNLNMCFPTCLIVMNCSESQKPAIHEALLLNGFASSHVFYLGCNDLRQLDEESRTFISEFTKQLYHSWEDYFIIYPTQERVALTTSVPNGFATAAAESEI
jgi:hypothetical protein